MEVFATENEVREARKRTRNIHADERTPLVAMCLLTLLDMRTADGISPTAVKDPSGHYYKARSAEDAFYISIGRSDLAIGG